MTYEVALAALADPTRRRLFERVRKRDYTVGELAVVLEISQPAVSQHLKVLSEANLVVHRCEGTCRYYRPNPKGLAELRRYVESLWDDALEAYASEDPAHRRKGRRK